jgi:putative ABC transport system permease protein
MPRLKLFFRLMVRPLFREPVRTLLTVAALALGVSVVLAIDLAGNAAAGSFRSSMETLAGDNDLEIVATGGVPDVAVSTLATQPDPLRISPRIEDYAVLTSFNSKRTLPLIGLDLIAEGSRFADTEPKTSESTVEESNADFFAHVGDPNSIWVGSSLGLQKGAQLELLVGDKSSIFTVRGVYPDSNGEETAILMDIAAAQRALNRFGYVDRVLVKLRAGSNLDEWQNRIRGLLPPGIEVRPQGTGTAENRKMLAAFRWNLRLLSYIALIVGAFLIYNTISVSVVRRRAEIGILRALGASRSMILAAFLGEACCFGIIGALVGLPIARLMASGAVRLISVTVNALYLSSRPGRMELTSVAVFIAFAVGVGISLVSAYAPAREASRVSPVEAIARGRREYVAVVHKKRDIVIALVLALIGVVAARMPAVAGKPVFGYVATVLLIGASAMAIPALVSFLTRTSSKLLGRIFGVETLLASRSLGASLRRTSVLVAALSTAVAMMTSVGIMVGSFRETVVLWMNDQLPADLYIRPAGDSASDRHPTLSSELTERIAGLPGVAAISRLRTYEISYDGLPATLASVDLRTPLSYRKSQFLSGQPSGEVLPKLKGANAVIVSEPFTYKHNVKAGDTITLPLGTERASFSIVDVYYDYGSERGTILMDRDTMLKYLPDRAPSNIAVFVDPHSNVEEVRNRIENVVAAYRVLVFSNRDLRAQAIRIFDQTFAITYALEAVAVIVAVMGIAGALLALVIDRRREMALLRFMGASGGQIRKLILAEAGLLGLIANIAGLVLGFFLSLILVFDINKQSFGWTIRFHWPVAILLGALTVVYVATVLAGLYPARVAVRLNPLEVVHED